MIADLLSYACWWHLRSSFILQTTYPRSSVTPALAGCRPSGMWRSPCRPPAVVVPTWLEGHTRHDADVALQPVMAPAKVRPGHQGEVHFGLLKPISFIPWFRNGPIGPYPNQGRIQRGGSGARSPSPMTRGAPAPKAKKRQYPSFFANNNQRAALRANRAQSLAGG